MINSTHKIHLNGTAIEQEALLKVFKFDSNDTYTRWVLRPLALLIGAGICLISLVTGVFILMLSLAMVPLLAAGAWALKRKVEREHAATDPVVETQA
jgi:hypothetical protein